MIYEIERLTAEGWCMARTNIKSFIQAQRECMSMQEDNPKQELRIVEVVRRVVR